VTTSFSVVSQPAGANATFNGSTVSGLTVAGNYTFRFTASDPTHTVFRDFVRTVVGSSPPPTEAGPPPLPGTGSRRRPPDTEASGRAVPRRADGASSDGPIRPNSVKRPAPSGEVQRVFWDLSGSLRPGDGSIEQLLVHLESIENLTPATDRWQTIEVLDQDGDDEIDAIVILFRDERVWVIRVVNNRT
jgi:hypothetical protein